MQDADGSPREDEIIAELLAVSPDVFTAERHKRATALAPTEPDLANRMRKIRKPTIAVWLINQLASAGTFSEAMDLATALQDAAAARDSGAMSALNRQRRTLVAALADQAAALATQHTMSVSAAARADIEATLNAAITDPGAAAAVMTARLLRPLAATGFGHLDLSDAVAGTPPHLAPESAGGGADDLAQLRSRKAAERALRAAEQYADQATRELARADAELRTARERRAHLSERIQQLQQTLTNLENEAETSAAAVKRLAQAQEQASKRARSTARQLTRSRAALPDDAAQ